MTVVPVVLAGGVGERFWPLSRSFRPKQLLPIVSGKSMIEETLARARPFCSRGVRPLIVTGTRIAAALRKALPKSVRYDCIREPVGKNTAPAVAAGAVWVQKKYGDALMLVLPADHAVRPARCFVEAARYAASLASGSESLCVFGIRPTRPETGYGYIQAGEAIEERGAVKSCRVRRFVEKPSEALAKSYVASGEYFWNSGMFVWKASTILAQIESHMPELHRRVQALARSAMSQSAVGTFYRTCPKESIDYGVMEKAARVVMVCPAFEWDDVGSWESVVRIHGINKQGNTLVGARIFDNDSVDSIVFNKSKQSVAACGLKAMVVVATDDALLVVPREKLPAIRQYIAAMKADRTLPRSIF